MRQSVRRTKKHLHELQAGMKFREAQMLPGQAVKRGRRMHSDAKHTGHPPRGTFGRPQRPCNDETLEKAS